MTRRGSPPSRRASLAQAGLVSITFIVAIRIYNDPQRFSSFAERAFRKGGFQNTDSFLQQAQDRFAPVLRMTNRSPSFSRRGKISRGTIYNLCKGLLQKGRVYFSSPRAERSVYSVVNVSGGDGGGEKPCRSAGKRRLKSGAPFPWPGLFLCLSVDHYLVPAGGQERVTVGAVGDFDAFATVSISRCTAVIG